MFRQFKYIGWSLIFLIASILTFSFYFQEAMFFDGITYSALSRNLYLGYGSFWKPYYNEVYSPFYNHPPLLYWILSKFYWLIGDNMYVPQIYNAIIFLGTAWVMRSIWIKTDDNNKVLDWLPFVFWVSSSIVFNTYRNTMLENTLSLFTLVSIRLLWEVVIKQKRVVLFITLSGGFIFLGFLTKGFVALFPLVFILLYFICFKLEFKKMLVYSILLCLSVSLLYYLVITLNPETKPYFDFYYHQHVFKAVAGHEILTKMGRVFLILQLLLELLPFIILSAISVFLCKRFQLKINFRMVIFLLLIGISASFPLFVSPKQRIYYLLPGYPYFILALALIVQPLAYHLILKLKERPFKISRVLSALFITSGIIYIILFTQINQKDRAIISDSRILAYYFPDKTIVQTPTDLATNWQLIAYFSRIAVLTPSDNRESKFILVRKGELPGIENVNKLELGLEKFDLYQKK